MFIFLLPGEFFLKFFERFFSSRFRVFIGIGPIRLYQSNTESVFRFVKSWPFCLIWPVTRSMVC